MQKPEFRKRVTVTVKPPDAEGPNRWCRIEPSEVYVEYGGTVTFKCAKGCGPLEVFVPAPRREQDLFPHSGRTLTVPAGGRTLTVRAKGRKRSGPHTVEYPYAVYCRACNCFGRGSMPRMMTGP